MSWMNTLYETYEQALQLDLTDEHKPMPISHTLQNAHINIVIDGEGNFRRAGVLEKTQIILPATESSASRSSGEAPHPLADKLQYIAKDYAQYGGAKKAYFDSYKTQLRTWCESSFSHPKISAVYRYVEKGHVIEDLVRSEIIHLDDRNILLTHWPSTEEQPKLFKVLPKKNGQIEQGDALVCWTVEETEGELSSNTWTDKTLQQSWIAFDASNEIKKDFCFISGEDAPIAINHPAKLRHTGDKAKLISSNDTGGYTYRGKFNNETEACGISFDVTQKAHNALRWLISRQGYRNGDQVIIAWAVSGKSVPSPLAAEPWKLFDLDDLDEISECDEDESTHTIDHARNIGQQFAERLKKALQGYRVRGALDDFETIIVMGLDSATPGRMGITYYREENAKDFFERLEAWYTDFAWPQRHTKEVNISQGKKKEKKVIWPISSPAPEAIAKAAYGQTLKDNLKKNTIERLLPCIVEKQPLPEDLVDACVRSASNPNAYAKDEKWLWRKNISIACALYKGYCSRNPNQRRNYQMSLERDYNGRDYLYGRLLALAEQIERRALDNSKENRVTNAERLMQRFSSRPFSTWKTIDESLRPYRDRLRASKHIGLLIYWEQEIEQICGLFDRKSFSEDTPLSGEYLLGYYCQKNYEKTKISESELDSETTKNEIN